MFTPPSFAVTDLPRLHEFIELHSFATLITSPASEPVASHLPLLLDRTIGRFGMAFGHMARANPQWFDADNKPALIIYHGPHAYISPRWYQAPNTVPTWNYVAVHAYGNLRIVTDHKWLRGTLRDTAAVYERDAAQPWTIDTSDESLLAGLLDAIVGFEISITRIEGKWKLSQNHSSQRRERVIESLRAAGGEQRQQIADLMQQVPDESLG